MLGCSGLFLVAMISFSTIPVSRTRYFSVSGCAGYGKPEGLGSNQKKNEATTIEYKRIIYLLSYPLCVFTISISSTEICAETSSFTGWSILRNQFSSLTTPCFAQCHYVLHVLCTMPILSLNEHLNTIIKPTDLICSSDTRSFYHHPESQPTSVASSHILACQIHC